MKKLLLLTGFSLAIAVPAFAQGFIDFSFTGGTGISVGTPSNPSAQHSGWLLGADYSVEAFMAAGSGQTEASLSPIANSLTTFAGGATTDGVNGSGLWFNSTTIDTGLAASSTATIQARVWYNGGGTYTSYAAALAAGVNTGKSTLYNIPLVSNTGTPTSMDTVNNGGEMNTFSVSGNAAPTPEPSTFALAGLGAAALLIFRRRK